MKSMKALTALLVLLLLLSSSATAYARGGRWSGIDPEIQVNGQAVNVWVGWASENNCSVEETRVRFLVPDGSGAVLVAESNDSLECRGGFIRLETRSEIKEAFERNMVSVEAEVKASRDFAVRVKIFRNGELAAECGGVSNEKVACGRVYLDNSTGEASSYGSRYDAEHYSTESFYVAY